MASSLAEIGSLTNAAKPHSEALTALYDELSLDATAQDIRILHLEPDLIHEKVVCALSRASLDDKPEYHAISYAWGDPGVTKAILLRGRIHVFEVQVTTNLELAL